MLLVGQDTRLADVSAALPLCLLSRDAIAWLCVPVPPSVRNQLGASAACLVCMHADLLQTSFHSSSPQATFKPCFKMTTLAKLLAFVALFLGSAEAFAPVGSSGALRIPRGDNNCISTSRCARNTLACHQSRGTTRLYLFEKMFHNN